MQARLDHRREDIAQLTRFMREKNIRAAVEDARHAAIAQRILHLSGLGIRARENSKVPRLEFALADGRAAREQPHHF